VEVNRSRPAHAYRLSACGFDSTCAVLFVDGTEVCRGDCSCRS